MTPRTGTGLRVEEALRLLPDVDALAPLRAFLVAHSRVRISDPYQTVGKRYVRSTDLKEMVPRAVGRVTEHLLALYEAAVDALRADEEGDLSGAVRAFLRAGATEALVGRDAEARAWYDQALRFAEELHDRRPEIETLHQLARLETGNGALDRAGRLYQRSLALSEAERDRENAAASCLGLGEVALANGQWPGAEAWFNHARDYADNDRGLTARLCLGLGEVARLRGQPEVAARWLERSRALFDEAGNPAGAARALDAIGLLASATGHYEAALTSHREALGKLRRVERDAALQVTIRSNIYWVYVELGRLPDAEDEIRRAEELAITYNLTRHLARLYLVMGKARGRQLDDTGFVFFEKAVELSRGRESSPRLEAEAYMEYAHFRAQFRDYEEARAYLTRSHEIAEMIGDSVAMERITAELKEFPPV